MEEKLIQCWPPKLEEKMDSMWILPLNHDYVNSLDLCVLSQDDLICFDLLRSISFLDVHLAIVAQSVPGENSSDYSIDCEDEEDDDLKDRSCWIDEWIYSTNSVPLCGKFRLNFEKQFVGNIERLLRKTSHQDPITKDHYTNFYHAAFIIQPRQQSIYLGCYRNFDRVLDQMYFLEKSSLSDAPIRPYLITNLKHCLSFCKMEPSRIWNDEKLCENVSSRAQRLMDVCVNLNAKEEGLELLSIIGMNLEPDLDVTEIDHSGNAEESEHICVGIRSTGVAEAIANFQCQVSGWNDCSDLVLNLIQPTNLRKQLNNFTSLIRKFLDNGCFEGAVKTAGRLWFVFRQLDWSNSLKGNEMRIYLEMVVLMEGHPKLADPQRIPQLLSFFRSLRSDQQCQIVIDCKISDKYFKSIPSCMQFHRDFCLILCEIGFENSPDVSSIIYHVIDSVSCLDDDSLLISLMDKILLERHSEVEDLPRNLLLEEIIKSEDIWNDEPLIIERLLANPTAANVLNQMFDERLHNFCNIIRSQDAVQDAKRTEDVQTMLSECLLFASCMEKYSQLSDPGRLSSFNCLVSRLSIAELAYLFFNLDESDYHSFRDQVSNSSTLSPASVVCHHALLRSAELINSQSIESKALFDIFVYLDKPSDVQSLIASVCQKGEEFGWEKSGSKEFVEHALKILCSWNEDDSDLKTFPSKIIRDMVANLIKSWVKEFSVWKLSQFDPGNTEPLKYFQTSKLSEKLAVMFKFLIEAERNWPGPFAVKNADRFQQLFTKLPFKIYVSLIEEIVRCELEKDGGAMKATNFKVDCPASFNLFRELCRQCLSHRENSVTSQELLLKCFIWLDNDPDSLNLICSKLLSSQIKIIVASKIFQELASTSSSQGKTAFCSLIDRRFQDLKASMYPDLSWSMPQARLPEYPEVEEFLHSTLKKLKYGDFINRQDANKLAELLRNDPSLSVLVSVSQKVLLLWEVVIVKIGQRRVLLPTEELGKKLELAKLTGLRASFCPNVQSQTSQDQRGEKRKTSEKNVVRNFRTLSKSVL